MAIQTTSIQSNAVGTRYSLRYIRGAKQYRYYDQFFANIMRDTQFNIESRRGMGTTYTFQFASRLTPGSTAISETVDIVPQIIRDATSTISTTSLGEAVKWSQLLTLESFMDEWAQRYEVLGINAMESIENQAINAALAGDLFSRATARASLDAGTTGHNFVEASIWKAGAEMAGIKAQITTLATSQSGAKVFYGAGADNASAVATTLNDTSALALDKTVVVSSSSNVSAGRHLNIGTEETGTTFYPTNETVKWISGTTTVTFIGAGANGGFRYDHANGEAVNNNDNVYPVLYGTPASGVKVYANDVGEFGQTVGPKVDGIADQWQSLAWKWFGGYGRVAENRLIRGEYSSSLDA